MSRHEASEEMMDCQCELLDRVLGSEVSSVELRAFEQHVVGCESCQLARNLTADFSKIGLAPQDELRIASIASKALKARRRPSSSSKTLWIRPVYRFLLAAFVVGGAAAAASMSSMLSSSSSDPLSGSEEGAAEGAGSMFDEEPVGESKSVGNRSRADAAEPRLSAPVQGSGGAHLVAEDQKGDLEVPASKSSQQTSVTAGSLFREANQARRRGDRAEAIELYGSLQRLFPATAEATLSLVSLGGLLLENGSTSAALLQFDRYLASAASRLTAEALYGRGRALRALGRKNDETKNWQSLLKSYPNSPYSGEARARLEKLR
jgi:TolA-binding protein